MYSDDAVYDALDTLVAEGAIAAYGVSVEKVDEALAAIARPNVATVQIILNAFRLKPVEVLPVAEQYGVGIIARTARERAALGEVHARHSSRRTTTAATTGTASRSTSARRSRASTTRPACARHRVRRTRPAGGADATPAWSRFAWIARQSGVSTVIPGARNPEQARANAAAGSLELPDPFDAAVRDLYDREIRASVHHRW